MSVDVNLKKPSEWYRSTVADGKWMQSNTLGPLWWNEEELSAALGKTYDLLDEKISDEALAREQGDTAIVNLLQTTSGALEQLINTETNRAKGAEGVISARADAAYLHAEEASAHAYTLLHTEIQSVSSTFNSFTGDYNTWKTDVDNWQDGIDEWKETFVEPNINGLKVASADLQGQIDAIAGASDVFDVVGKKSGTDYDKGDATTYITPNAIVKVLSGDDNRQEYWKWDKGPGKKTKDQYIPWSEFTKVGDVQPYYSTGEIDTMLLSYAQTNDVYTKTQADNKFQTKTDMSNYYTKNQTSSNSQLTTEFNKYAKTTELNNYLQTSTFNTWSANADYKYQHASAAFHAQVYGAGFDISAMYFRLYNNSNPDAIDFWYTDNTDTMREFWIRKNNDIHLHEKQLETCPDGLPSPQYMRNDTYYIV